MSLPEKNWFEKVTTAMLVLRLRFSVTTFLFKDSSQAIQIFYFLLYL